MDWTIAIVLTGAAAAGFAQGVSGFAFSLVSLAFRRLVLGFLFVSGIVLFAGSIGAVLGS